MVIGRMCKYDLKRRARAEAVEQVPCSLKCTGGKGIELIVDTGKGESDDERQRRRHGAGALQDRRV